MDISIQSLLTVRFVLFCFRILYKRSSSQHFYYFWNFSKFQNQFLSSKKEKNERKQNI